MPVDPDFPRPDPQTRIVVMLSYTMRSYAEKYRNIWEWSPLIHKKRFHVKASPGKLTKAESSAWCYPKSDNRVEELYALLSFC